MNKLLKIWKLDQFNKLPLIRKFMKALRMINKSAYLDMRMTRFTITKILMNKFFLLLLCRIQSSLSNKIKTSSKRVRKKLFKNW